MRHYRPMLHSWVKHKITGRVAQVKKYAKNEGAPEGVMVHPRGDKIQAWWPTQSLEPTPAPKKRTYKRSK